MNAPDIHGRLRLAAMRAVAELQGNLLRPVRPVEIYNSRGLRLEKSQEVEAELVACWKDRLLTRNPSGEYDLKAEGRQFLQDNAGKSAPDASSDIPVSVSKQKRKYTKRNPESKPGPVHHITPASEEARAAGLTEQLRANAAGRPVFQHVEKSIQELETMLRHHEQRANELRNLINDLREFVARETA